MTADNPLPFVPKLRFPEFRDGPRWHLLTLSSASDVNPSNDGLPESFIYIDLESVKSSVLIERKEITRDAAPSRAQRLLSRKDIIYQTVRPYQRNNFFFDISDGYEYVASTGYAQLRAHECPAFLYQLLHTNSFVNSVLARCTGSNYPAINPSDLASIHVALPRKSEQQKIADCLGSLDDLIAAEGRELDALRQHKQGLMQQLFPQPGETVPLLRFPEFRDAGEWEEKKIGDLSGVKASGDLDAAYFSNFRSTTHLYPIYSNAVENAGLYGYYSVPQYKKNSVTITARGTLGVAFLRNHEFMGIGRLIVVSNLRNLDPCFLKECWNHLAVIPREVTSIPQLTAIAVRAIVLPIPRPAEQQRIATCLSSLDNVLAAQARKIDALKQQKQGLLQQLFPSVETK